MLYGWPKLNVLYVFSFVIIFKSSDLHYTINYFFRCHFSSLGNGFNWSELLLFIFVGILLLHLHCPLNNICCSEEIRVRHDVGDWSYKWLRYGDFFFAVSTIVCIR